MTAVSFATPHSVAPGGSFCKAEGIFPQPGVSGVNEALEHSILVRFTAAYADEAKRSDAPTTTKVRMPASYDSVPACPAKFLTGTPGSDYGRMLAAVDSLEQQTHRDVTARKSEARGSKLVTLVGDAVQAMRFTRSKADLHS